MDRIDPEDVVDRLLSRVVGRIDCFKVAMDRGEGKPRNIENWMLVEMTAELKNLMGSGLKKVNGEHGYPKAKTGRADLWWETSSGQHWVEVKAVLLTSRPKASVNGIRSDLKKLKKPEIKGTKHELVILFPTESGLFRAISDEIDNMCGNEGFSKGRVRPYDLDGLGVSAILFTHQ